MKKTITLPALLIAIGFTAFIIVSVVHNWQNKRHSVEFFSASQHEHHENTPATAQIQISPQIAWDRVPFMNKFLGWVFLAALWYLIWFVDNDKHLGRSTSRKSNSNALGILLLLGPLVLSAVMFFASYSSIFSNNYVSVTRERFDNWLNSGVIEKKGEKTYVDKSDSIKLLFEKPIVK